MNSIAIKTLGFAKQRTHVLREIRKMREAMEDLTDYLDLLEARARNRGKTTYSIHEVKQRLGIK
jgi:hypothetical protein